MASPVDHNTLPVAENEVNPPFPASVFDIHCHLPAPQPGRIICLDPVDGIPPLLPDQYYSVGIHPWNATKFTAEDLLTVERLAAQPQVLAIGEVGFDTLRAEDPAAAINAQQVLARRHVEIAESVGKPVIWHIVRLWDNLLALKKSVRPTCPWIIHGFTGNTDLATQLTRAGIMISLGPKARPEVRVAFHHFNESDALPAQ